MMRLVLIRILPVVCVIVLIFSCSGYEKALKSTDYKAKYELALSFYEKEDYVRSAALLDQCAPVFRGTKQADSVYYFQAMSYYFQKDYTMAGHFFMNLSNTYGGSKFVEESDYMTAYCYYKTSPRASLDQTTTKQAIQQFQLFLIRYPRSEKKEQVLVYIDELKNKLVEKSYMSAKLYFDLSDYKASMVSLTNCLAEYPESWYREDIMFMILKSSYLLADKSVRSKQKERYQDAIDEYYSFLAEFPESKYSREAKKYYRLSAEYLGDDILEENEEELN